MKSLFAAALVCLAASTASAEIVLRCDAVSTDRFNAVSDRAYYYINQQTGQVRVLDRIINSEFGEPIPATVKRRGNGNLFINWRIDGREGARGETADLLFQTILRQNMTRFETRVTIPSFDNVPSARGRCKVQQ